MRRSALHESHRELGALFSESAGWEVVSDYGDIVSEHRSVRSAAGVVDLSHRGRLRVSGGDRVRFLHGMVTNDVKGLRDGQGIYSAMITAQGQTLADLKVYRRPTDFLLDTGPGLAEEVRAALDRYLIADDVQIDDVTEATSLLLVSGPLSADVVGEVLGADVSGLPEYGSAQCGSATVVRSDDTGERGFLLFVEPVEARRLWAGIQELGLSVRPVGQRAFSVLRMEAGVPVYGLDIEKRYTPIESGIAHAVSLDKGCYIGQEVISKMTFRGKPRRHLVGFVLAGDVPPTPGDTVMVDGRDAGHATSGLLSLSLNQIIAFGYVKRDLNRPGTKVQIASNARRLEGEVVGLPFYRRQEQP